MSRAIIIDVKRDDGQVTRLNGASGIAACAPNLAEELITSEPAMVSMRCSTEAEIAWNLACILATVMAHSPAAYDMAHALAPLIDAKQPTMIHKLPKWERGKDE